MSKVKNDILAHINARVLTPKDTGGHRDFADLCCDIINADSRADNMIAASADLSTATVRRMRENVKPYAPSSRTIEKILKANGFTMELS